jgi:hypothetical protein
LGLTRIIPDRWTVVELVGAALLVGGVWAQWGAPWACMLLGALLLIVAGIAARQSAAVQRTEE